MFYGIEIPLPTSPGPAHAIGYPGDRFGSVHCEFIGDYTRHKLLLTSRSKSELEKYLSELVSSITKSLGDLEVA